MYLYLEAGMLAKAREVACLGLTAPDWKVLGQIALQKLDLEVCLLNVSKRFSNIKVN